MGCAFVIVCMLLPVSLFAGDYDAEIAKQQKVYEADSTNFDAAYSLGNYLAWDKRYEEALKVFEGILAREPKYIDAEIGMARVYAWKGDNENAARNYQDVLTREPKNYEAYQGLGSLALWINKFDESIDHFKKALSINPKDIASLKGIGRAYLGRGDRRLAEEYFTKAQILEIRRTSLPLILAVGSGVAIIILTALFLIRRCIRHRKNLFLQMELKNLRLGISLYYQITGKYPLAIESLLNEKWRHPGEKEDTPYLEGLRLGERGLIVDPFGRHYWYNPDTGKVYSTTKGCEKW
ncbi:MAG: tetratricopeptide repeat protein [Pseudomonadota bacterium]